MKLTAILFTVFAFALSAQDNAQSFTSPRTGVPEFAAIGPDVGRGPAGYKIQRGYSVGAISAISSNGNPFPPTPGSALFDEFVSLNAAAALPIDLRPVGVAFTSRLSRNPVAFAYAPAPGFVGSDVQTVTYTDADGALYATTTITFHVDNTPPTVAAAASPQTTQPGAQVAFSANAADADGHALTFAWDFGDGVTDTGATPTHAYTAPGVYAATVTVNDGFVSVQSGVTVDVAGVDRVPTARFTTSDVVGFATSPLVFDAAFSTDPQNSALTYAWDFGDGSPVGAGSLIAKIYTQPGSYDITLTVTDAEGLRASLTHSLEVLPANAIGTFDASVELATTFNGAKQNADRVTLKAVLNVGDTQLADGSGVALEFGGKRFEAQLDKRLRKTAAAGRWVIKTKLRNQPFGSVDIRATLKGSGLLAGLLAAGAEDDAEIDLPVRIECGGKVFDIFIPTAFQITGQRGRGNGEL